MSLHGYLKFPSNNTGFILAFPVFAICTSSSDEKASSHGLHLPVYIQCSPPADCLSPPAGECFPKTPSHLGLPHGFLMMKEGIQ